MSKEYHKRCDQDLNLYLGLPGIPETFPDNETVALVPVPPNPFILVCVFNVPGFVVASPPNALLVLGTAPRVRPDAGVVVVLPNIDPVAFGAAAPNKLLVLVPGFTVCKLLNDNTFEAVVVAAVEPNLKAPVDAVDVAPNPLIVAGFEVVRPLKAEKPVDVALVFGAPKEIVDGVDAEKALPTDGVAVGAPKENPGVAVVPKPVGLF